MKRSYFLPFCMLILIVVTFASCQSNKATDVMPKKMIPVEQLAGDVISESVRQQIALAGFSTDKVKKAQQGYIVEGDILLTQANLDAYQAKNQPTKGHTASPLQWYTDNTVYAPTNQYHGNNIYLQLDDDFRYYPSTTDYFNRTIEAAARYNAVNSPGLRFLFIHTPPQAVLSSSLNVIHIHKVNNTYYSGLAGFPDGGKVYPDIYLNTDYLDNEAASTVTTIIAHEIGHCIGFRHTDWYDRSISGCYGNEGAAPYGANQIPGTSADPNSWMLACYNPGQDRPFVYSDIVSLRYLYSGY